jgi:hypothetical protein
LEYERRLEPRRDHESSTEGHRSPHRHDLLRTTPQRPARAVLCSQLRGQRCSRHACRRGKSGVRAHCAPRESAVTTIYTRPYRDGFNLDAPLFFAGFDPEAVVAAKPGLLRDARYGMANAFQGRREIRVQVRLTF